MLDIEAATKQAVKEKTDDDREVLALFEEYRQTQRLVHGATGTTDFHSAPTEEYLQAFANFQEGAAKPGSDDEGFEGSSGDDAEGEADDEQSEDDESGFFQEEDAWIAMT